MKFLKIPDDGLLQLIIQTLRRNATERGLQAQGEMAELLVMAAFGDQDKEPEKVLPLNPKQAGYHLLEVLDSDGHSFGQIVAHWWPGQQIWTLNPLVGSARYKTAFHRYVAPIVLP